MTGRAANTLGRAAIILVAALAVASCGERQPSGQVLAVVGDTDITRRDVAAQLGGSANQQAAEREAALEAVIQRELLARAARKRRIDTSPEYLNAVRQARTSILIAQLEASILADLPPPTNAEIDAFVASHPQIFAGRMRIVVSRSTAAAAGPVTIDSAMVAAPVAKQLAAGAIGRPMQISADGRSETITIISRTPTPLMGQAAKEAARQTIRRQRLDRALAQLIGAERARTAIRYQPGTGPSAR